MDTTVVISKQVIALIQVVAQDVARETAIAIFIPIFSGISGICFVIAFRSWLKKRGRKHDNVS